jgi:hypothetical protein
MPSMYKQMGDAIYKQVSKMCVYANLISYVYADLVIISSRDKACQKRFVSKQVELIFKIILIESEV